MEICEQCPTNRKDKSSNDHCQYATGRERVYALSSSLRWSCFFGYRSGFISHHRSALIDYPIRKKPIVFYGTSILQGGCASRPGMAHTNIISRRLNRECINLGFSGNGQLDLEVARVMAEVDAGVFVLDFVPNASVEQMKERMETFTGSFVTSIRKLRLYL